MSATTAEPTTERDVELVSQPDTAITYFARREELRLTMRARYPIRNPVTGQPEGMSRGIFIGFREGKVRIPREGTVNLVDTLDGGEFEMDAAEVHQWLQKHRRFGDRMEGFWLHEEPAPPVTREELERIVNAATEWDVPLLERILGAERAGWDRPDIIRVAEGSIEKIRAMEARVAEEAGTVAAAAVDEERKARETAEQERLAAEERADALERELAAARAAAAEAAAGGAEPAEEPKPRGKGK